MRAIGQGAHHAASRLTIWSAGYRVRRITPLEPEAALKQGAEFVGESVIFCISGSWLLYEYQQAARKAQAAAEAKRCAAKAERDELRTQLRAIDVRLAALETAMQKQWGLGYQVPLEKQTVAIKGPLSLDDDDDEEEEQPTIQTATTTTTTPETPNNQDDNVGKQSKGWTRWIWPF